MHVKDVTTFAPDYIFRTSAVAPREKEIRNATERTVVPGHLAARTASLVGNSTYPTHVTLKVSSSFIGVCIARVPSPLGDCVPVFYADFHGDGRCRAGWGEGRRGHGDFQV
jgi:hypothetical protein